MSTTSGDPAKPRRRINLSAEGAEKAIDMAIDIISRHPSESVDNVDGARLIDYLDAAAAHIRYQALSQRDLEKRIAEYRKRLTDFVEAEGFIEDPGDIGL